MQHLEWMIQRRKDCISNAAAEVTAAAPVMIEVLLFLQSYSAMGSEGFDSVRV